MIQGEEGILSDSYILVTLRKIFVFTSNMETTQLRHICAFPKAFPLSMCLI